MFFIIWRKPFWQGAFGAKFLHNPLLATSSPPVSFFILLISSWWHVHVCVHQGFLTHLNAYTRCVPPEYYFLSRNVFSIWNPAKRRMTAITFSEDGVHNKSTKCNSRLHIRKFLPSQTADWWMSVFSSSSPPMLPLWWIVPILCKKWWILSIT